MAAAVTFVFLLAMASFHSTTASWMNSTKRNQMCLSECILTQNSPGFQCKTSRGMSFGSAVEFDFLTGQEQPVKAHLLKRRGFNCIIKAHSISVMRNSPGRYGCSYLFCSIAQAFAIHFICKIPWLSTIWVQSLNTVHKLISYAKKKEKSG